MAPNYCMAKLRKGADAEVVRSRLGVLLHEEFRIINLFNVGPEKYYDMMEDPDVEVKIWPEEEEATEEPTPDKVIPMRRRKKGKEGAEDE